MPGATTSTWCWTFRCSLSVELGRTKVPIKYIPQLAQGSVVELDALAGEPMDVLVNGLPDRPGRGGGGERQVRYPPDRRGHPSERLRRVSRGG